eukprot:scaffold2113_cov146-Skeletonema_menzelii.AAC.15
MASTTTTTTSGEQQHGEEESGSINNISGGERRVQQHCSEEESSSFTPIAMSNSDHVSVSAAPVIDTTYSCPTNHAPPLRKHTGSCDNMADISFINLREEDADILELGVEEKRMQDVADFDEDGRRLENTSHHRLSSASLSSLVEGLSLEGSFDRHYDPTNSDGSNNTNSAANEVGGSSAAPNIRLAIHEDSSMPVIAEDSSFSIPHVSNSTEGIFRGGGAGGGQPQDDHAEKDTENDENDESDYFLGESPEIQPKDRVNATEVDIEALALRIASGRAHNRSVSFDRRMIESAQFAEAVGEDPSLLLQKIIEQDSDSDFDDDDIDEGGDMLGGKEEFSEESLQDYKPLSIETVGSISGEEAVGSHSPDVAAGSTVSSSAPPSSEEHDTLEPKCVSTDLSRVSPKEQEQVCNRERKQSFDRKDTDDSQLLPTFSNVSAPPTPIPSPAKARISPFTSFHPPYVDWKFQRQSSSSASLDGNRLYQQTVTQNINNNDAADFRGIRLPEITKRGVARGNYAQLHRKAWLEVSDKHHRYGKNLRMYYKHWESLGHPYHMFFDWLDAKGEAQDTELPNLPEIPRSVLDSDTVQYITDPGLSASYALDIVADPADGSAYVIDRRTQTPICTGKEGWIFVLRDHVFYGSQKVIAPHKVDTSTNNADEKNATAKPRQRFHHSSFFGGKAVASAGIFLTDDQGHLTHLYPHSGHYRPGEAHVQRVLFFLQQLGVELSTFVVDMQQLFKVSRKFAPKGGNSNDVVDKENTVVGKQPVPQIKKAKKTDCLHLMCGLETACFLAHKALMIERGVFHQIHKIRRIPPDSRNVRNILNHVNKSA